MPGKWTTAPVKNTPDRLQGFGAHLFLAVEGFGVIRNIFLDGNTFSDSHRVARQPFLAQAGLGLAMHYKWINLSYAQVIRSRFIADQPERVGYGSIHFCVSF